MRKQEYLYDAKFEDLQEYLREQVKEFIRDFVLYDNFEEAVDYYIEKINNDGIEN